MTTPAGSLGDATITVTANTDPATNALRQFTRDTQGRLRDVRGRFVSESALISRSANSMASSFGSLLPVATAAVPIVASLGAAAVATAGAVAAAGVATAAFGIAVAGQVSAITEALDAQTQYNEAVEENGRGSQEAADAQRALAAQYARMPAATQRATASLQVLQETFREFSDETAQFTMVPVEKSFVVLRSLIPELTPLVRGASEQFDRLITIVGGAISTPEFDALSQRFSVFANEVLRDAITGIISFSRALSQGEATGPISAFIEFARANGPEVRETLTNISAAVTTLVEAAATAGPGLLTLVNAAAQLVAALPPEVVAVALQLAVALKLVSVAGAAIASVTGIVVQMRTAILSLSAASAAAGGGLAGLRAAFLSLGIAARASLVVAAISAVVVAAHALSTAGDEVPPDVEKLTNAFGELGSSGRVVGEAAKVLGEDFGKLRDQLDRVIDPSVTESINNWLFDLSDTFFVPGEATEEFTRNMASVDDALAGLVQAGNADLAREALVRLTAGMSPEQIERFRSELDGYDEALANVALEQELTAQSMGIFGAAAQETQTKLDGQKQSADGLRASILALNEVNRSALDAEIAFEASVDDLTASFKENGATLDLNTEKGRANATAFSQAAKARDELLAAGIAAGDSLGEMTKRSDALRASMLRLATEAFDGNKKKAQEYINTLLGTPDEITTLVKAERADALTGIREVQAEIAKTPKTPTVTVRTLNAAAIAALEAVGLKTRQLPDGRTEVSTANRQALGAINAVDRALERINGRTSQTFIITNVGTRRIGSRGGFEPEGMATGGLVGFPHGGLISGPGTGTSDSILARVSNGEFVVRARAVNHFGEGLFEDLNNLRMPASRTGGAGGGGGAVAAAPQVVTVNVNLENRGVIGSRFELQNWLAGALDDLRLQGRLPQGVAP